jgi:hypothetical protein
MRRTSLFAMLTLVACSKPASPPVNAASGAAGNAATNSAAAPANPKLAQIFTPDILGANVAWLETITGPAFSSEGAERTYKVGDCQVIVGVARARIANIGISNYGPACNFPIAQYFATGYDHPLPSLPTFGDIKAGLGGAYAADCLRLCGNAADPVVSLSYQGSHADNFTNLYAAISVVDDRTVAAYADWGDKLAAKYGEAYVASGKFRSGDDLDGVAAEDFAAIRPTTIRVGADLPAG